MEFSCVASLALFPEKFIFKNSLEKKKNNIIFSPFSLSSASCALLLPPFFHMYVISKQKKGRWLWFVKIEIYKNKGTLAQFFSSICLRERKKNRKGKVVYTTCFSHGQGPCIFFFWKISWHHLASTLFYFFYQNKIKKKIFDILQSWSQ